MYSPLCGFKLIQYAVITCGTQEESFLRFLLQSVLMLNIKDIKCDWFVCLLIKI